MRKIYLNNGDKSNSVRRFLQKCILKNRFCPWSAGIIWRLAGWSQSHNIPHICLIPALSVLAWMIELEEFVRATCGIFLSKPMTRRKAIVGLRVEHAAGLVSEESRRRLYPGLKRSE
jgi:hypothetical protein